MKTRAIKFRAWDGKEMWDGSFCLWEGLGSDVILMQFTGLLDVNGKEIYEGDIVKSLSYNEIQEIKWHEHLFVESEENNGFPSCAGWFIHTPHSSELEIIGNIYQNHEILTN